MNSKVEKFWRTHLATTNSPMIHFALTGLLDVEAIKNVADEIGFALFFVDANAINSELSLMDAFSESMNFPPYFGRNWNALLDLTQDLSWARAEGYILFISNGDNLPSLPFEGFFSLVEVVEATVRSWRDERGEFGERTRPVPFHAFFSGSEALKESLLRVLKEPLCEHMGELFINIHQAPVQLRKTAAYQEAENLVAAGADTEMVLSFLREHGMDERDSMYAIAGLMGTTVTEAKSVIYNCQTWSEVRERDEQRRRVARDAIRNLGWEDK